MGTKIAYSKMGEAVHRLDDTRHVVVQYAPDLTIAEWDRIALVMMRTIANRATQGGNGRLPQGGRFGARS